LQDDSTQPINFEEKLSLMDRGLPNCLLQLINNGESQGNPETRCHQSGNE
jgi:hypothetical protein